MLRAERLRRGRERLRRLSHDLAQHEQAADPVPRFERGDLLPDDRVGRIRLAPSRLVQREVRQQAIDAAALVLELAHRLLPRAALLSDEVRRGNAHVLVEDLAEVAVRRHVLDRGDRDAGRVERNDELADACVRRSVSRRAADQVAVVRGLAEARPDLLPVDDVRVAVTDGPGAKGREIRSGIGLAHPDAPPGLAADDPGEELLLLFFGAVGQDRRAHLPIGEPRARDRCTLRDQCLGDDEPLEHGASTTAPLDRPCHPEPPPSPSSPRELAGVPVDPCVVVLAVLRDRLVGDLLGFGPQRLQFG